MTHYLMTTHVVKNFHVQPDDVQRCSILVFKKLDLTSGSLRLHTRLVYTRWKNVLVCVQFDHSAKGLYNDPSGLYSR